MLQKKRSKRMLPSIQQTLKRFVQSTKPKDEVEEVPIEDVFVKVAIIGDAQSGKTSVVRRFHDDRFSEEYVQTTGLDFVEKRIKVGANAADVVFTLCDLGSDKTSAELLPLVCDDSTAVIFVFDLTRKNSLDSVKDYYRKVRTLNTRAIVLLVGCKFDLFLDLETEDQEEIVGLARRYARAMKAPLIFTSASHSINVQKVFKILFGKVFSIDCKVERITAPSEPIIEY
jgi:GTP-binding protein of the ras superfamily involved in termination of M-phase